MRRASQIHKESSSSVRTQPRTRDDKKLTTTTTTTSTTAASDGKQKDSATAVDTMKSTVNATEDVYEFKSVKDADSSPEKSFEGDGDAAAEATDPLSLTSAASSSTTATSSSTADDSSKRTYSEYEAGEETSNDDDNKRKKRKDDGGGGGGGKPAQRNTGQGKGQGGKQSSGNQGKSGSKPSGGGAAASSSGAAGGDKKSPCASPKPVSASSDAEGESGDGKTIDLKVPPLKIVIPQGAATEQDAGTSRNGKSSSQRSHHQALPYVVASSSNDSVDKDLPPTTANSPEGGSANAKDPDKKEQQTGGNGQSDEQRVGSQNQRVLRSSHRGASHGSTSSDLSPQQGGRHSPSGSTGAGSPPPAHHHDDDDGGGGGGASSTANCVPTSASDTQANSTGDVETSAPSATVAAPSPAAPVELHPRKRKLKQNKEQANAQQQQQNAEPADTASESREVHPHDQPITNCYKLFMNIRKQIEKRRKGLFPVQPKPPQGFKDYLMNRCTYVLAGTAPTTPNVVYPPNLPQQLKDLFVDQEKERYKLRMQHVIEKEKLVLSVEQEILRVHGRAARALANQSLPFSVCTILRDEEVYNLITPEQEEKDRNARSRYNGRLFLSWLQDVDDKWEKIKEHMLLRHHNEAESLHAVQKMNWEWKMKEHSLCDRKSTPKIDEVHVPMVHVSDDFDLLPA